MTPDALATGPSPAVRNIAAQLERETGLVWSATRQNELTRAVAGHAGRLTGADEDALAMLFERDRPSFDDFVADVTVPESYFFRDPEQFELLKAEVLPSLVATHGDAIRVWSAGCAAGEETYSLAITLDESGTAGSVPVLGTDISRLALDRAARATYRPWSFRGTSDDRRERYFERATGGWRPREALRRRVRFERLNLASSDTGPASARPSDMHVIFCENVLIYLAPAAVAAVATRLHDALAVDGWLFTAITDPRLDELAPFGTVTLGDRVVYRRAAAARGSARIPEVAMPVAPPAVPSPITARPPAVVRPTAVVAPPAESAVVSGDDRVARIRALADAGRSVEAHALAVSGTKADPGSVELHYLAAVILLERGDRLGAATAARRAAYLEPGLALVDIVLASALRGSGDLNGARRAYRRAHTELARADASALVRFGDGERAGGLLQMVETLIAALERQS